MPKWKPLRSRESLDHFWSRIHELADAMHDNFPDCQEVTDWRLWARNIVGDDEAQRHKGVVNWSDSMLIPLKKATYAKAVQSITSQRACVYHAVAYKDVDGVHAACTPLQTLSLPDKLATMDVEDVAVFWDYMEELTRHAFAYVRETPPVVPSIEAIDQDIQRRKAAKAGGGSSGDAGGSFSQGIHEGWKHLCELRGVSEEVDLDVARMHAVATRTIDGATVQTLCSQRALRGFVELARDFPVLTTTPPDEEQWKIIDGLFTLVLMERALPPSMMQGIEQMANQLMTSMDTVDLETLGQQVLSNVSMDDMAKFTKNLDGMLPEMMK